MKLPTLPADKANHVVYGVAIALVAKTAAAWLHVQHGVDLGGASPHLIGLLAATLFAAGKEVADKVGNAQDVRAGRKPSHTVDPMDALATISGGVAVWLAGV